MKKTGQVDESTDSYDTIDWLIINVPRNNKRVAIFGTSYPGFYTTASCIDRHPALEACEPGAPMTDLWMGDDLFHNGALSRGLGNSLGLMHWETQTGPWFRDSIEFPFYLHYLKDAPMALLPKALLFRTGGEGWDRLESWPQSDAVSKTLYLSENGALSWSRPTPNAQRPTRCTRSGKGIGSWCRSRARGFR